jgi:hypothetical protein
MGADCLGDPTGVRIRRGDRVGEVSGVNKYSNSESMLAADSAGEGGFDFADVGGDKDEDDCDEDDSLDAAVRRTRLGWIRGCCCFRSRFLLGEVWIRICRVSSSERENRFSQPAKVH